MDSFAFEVALRTGAAPDAPPVHSPALADAVVEPPRRPISEPRRGSTPDAPTPAQPL